MNTIEYKVAISGDNEQLKKVIADSQGRLERIDDKHILVGIDYDGNYEEFYKIIQKIYKECPEVGINFQYHMNKKALEQELSSLQDYELSIKDPKAAYDKLLKETNAFIEKYNNSVAKRKQFDFVNNSLDEDSDKYGTLNSEKFEWDRKRILSIYNTFLKLDKKGEYAKNFSPIIDNLVGSFQELDTGFEGVIEDIVGSQKERVDEIQANVDAIVQKAKEMGIELESALGGGGSGGGGGGGDKTIHVYMDTTNFDEGVAHVKSELDSLPNEKRIRMTVDTGGSDDLGKMISGWSQAMMENGWFTNEHYAVYNSKTGQLSGGYTEGEPKGIKAANFDRLTPAINADTWVHSHPANIAAFSNKDIETALKRYEDGVINQVVIAKDEVMSICLDALDIPKFTQEVDLEAKYEAADRVLESQLKEKLAQNPKLLRDYFENYLESAGVHESRIETILSSYDTKDLDTSNLDEVINSAVANAQSAIEDFEKTLGENTGKNTKKFFSVLKDQVGMSLDNQALEAFSNNTQQAYQNILKEVFSDSKYLKEGYTSAISIAPITDYISQERVGSEAVKKVQRSVSTPADIRLSISNIDTLRSEIDSKLNKDTFSIFVYPELSATGVENFKQEVDKLLSDIPVNITPNLSAEAKEALSSNIATNEVSSSPTIINPKADMDITDFSMRYEMVMNTIDELNQTKASVIIDADTDRFTEEINYINRQTDDIKDEFVNVKFDSNVASTLKGLQKVKELQQNLDATPINVPIQLGSTTEFKKQLKEFGKTQTIDVGVTPKISSESIKSLKEEVETKLNKNSKGNSVSVNIKPAVGAEETAEFRKALQKALGYISLNTTLTDIKLDTEQIDKDIAHVKSQLDDLTTDRTIKLKLDSTEVDGAVQKQNEIAKAQTTQAETKDASEATKIHFADPASDLISELRTQLQNENFYIYVYPYMQFTNSWDDAVEQIRSSLGNIKITPKISAEDAEELQKQIQKATGDIEYTSDSLRNLRESISKDPVSIDIDLNNAEALSNQIKEAVLKVSPIPVELKPTLSSAGVKDVAAQIAKEFNFEAVSNKPADGYTSTKSGVIVPNDVVINEEQKKAETKKNDEKLAELKKQAEAINKIYKGLNNAVAKGNRTAVFASQVQNLKKDIDELNSKPIDIMDSKQLSLISELTRKVNELNAKLPLNTTKRGNATQLASLRAQVTKVLTKNSGMSGGQKLSYNDVLSRIDKAIKSDNTTVADVQDIARSIKMLNSELNQSGKSNSFLDLTADRLRGINAQFIAQYLSIQDFIRYIQMAATEVIKLDTAMTELHKVSNASVETLNKSFERSTATAKELGATISDVINMTADWARQGYSVDESEELARVTTLFKNVGDNMTADQASSYMISTMQGFQIEAENAIDIVDKYNEVANNFAISTEGIGEALQNSAASFNAANTDLSEAIALITTANTIAQDPESVGNAFKILSARIRGASNELKELGEDETEVVSSASMRDYVKGITGVDILEEDGKTFKSLYDILLGISKVWNDLSDLEQQGLVEKLAGKNRSNILLALLQNGQDLEKAYSTAVNSSGSAMKEQANYAQSVQFSIDKAKASLQELASTTLNTDDVKNAVELFNSLVQAVNTLIDLSPAGILAPLATMFGTASAVKNASSNNKFFTGISETIRGIKLYGRKDELFGNERNARDKYNDALKELEDAKGDSARISELPQLESQLSDATSAFEAAKKEAAPLNTALKALKGTLITLGIEAAIAAIYSLATAQSRLREVAEEAVSAYDEVNKQFNDYTSQIEAQYEVLENSESTYEQQLEAKQALYDIQGQLISSYGEEAGSIISLTGEYQSLETVLKSINELKSQELSKAWTQYAELNNSSNPIDYIIDSALNLGSGASNNAERAVNDYKRYKSDAPVRSWGGTDADREYNKRVKEILSKYNLSTVVDDVHGEGEPQIVGYAPDVISALEEMQKVANQLDLSNISKQIASSYAEASNYESTYKALVNAMTYMTDISGNEQAENSLRQFEDYSKQLEDATVKGDSEALARLQSEALNYVNSDAYISLSDDAIRYIENLYPQLKAQIDAWEFDIKFKDNTADITNHAKAFSNTEELRNALNGNTPESELTDGQREAVGYFRDQGYNTDSLVSYVGDNGILQTKTAEDFEDRIKSLTGEADKLTDKIKDFDDEQKAAFLDATRDGQDATKAWEKYCEAVTDTTKALSAGEVMSKMSTAMDDGFKDLKTFYNDIKGGNDFDFSALVDSATNLSIDGKTTEQFNELKDVIAQYPDDIAKCQAAFNNLVTAFIQAKIETEGLTADNEATIASYLESQGVTNATAVAHGIVTQALAQERAAALELEYGTNSLTVVSQLCKEAEQLEAQGATDAAEAYKGYAAEKLAANIELLTSDQILQLSEEAKQLGITAAEWINYYKAKKDQEAAISASALGKAADPTDRGYNPYKKHQKPGYEIEQKLNQKEQDIKNEQKPTATYTAPVSGTRSGSGSGSGDSNKGQTIDQSWDERAVKQAERNYQKYVDILEDESKSYSERLAVYEEANRDQWKQSYETFVNYAKQYREAINGSLDITAYTPTWSAEDNRYKTDLGETTAVVSNGSKTFTVQIATKLADGTELTPEQAQEYLKTLTTNSGDDLLKSDTKNILIRFVEGNDPNAFVYEQGQDQVKNLQYLRDLSYGTYKEQKDQIDSLTESLNVYLKALQKQIDLYKKAAENDKAKVKEQFGEEKGKELIELAENGSLDADTFRTYITDATEEQKQALEDLIEDFEKIDSLQDDYEDKQKLYHEYRMKRYEEELEELEAIQSVYEAYQSIYESQISLKEATGKLVTANDYSKLLNNSEQIIDSYERQLNVLREQLDYVEDESSEYYETKAKILEIEDSLIQVKEQQAEWNEEIKNIPINLLDQYLERLKAIQNLVSNFMDLQTTYGKANTADEYKEIFKIANDNIEYALKQQKELKSKLSGYQWGSDKYNETASSIESINDDISSILEQMEEWNQAILNIPLDKLNEVNEQLNLVITAMSDIESEYDQVISAVTESIDKQIEGIEDEQDAYDDSVQDRIDKIQELIDALEEENTAREKILEVENAEYELEKSRAQKSIAVIRNGSLTYESDEEELRDKQRELDEAEYNYRIYQLQQQIEQLEKEKEDKDDQYQDEIDNLQKIADKWSEITSNIELAKDQLKATEYLGDGWLNKVLTGDDAEIYEQFKTLYETMDKDLTQYQEQVASNERIATLMEQFITQYENGSITYSQALNGLNSLVSALTSGLDVNGTLSSYKELFTGSNLSSLSTVLSKLQASAQTEANNLAGYLSIYKSNEEIIAKYTSSWEELKKSVDEQIKALKAAYEAALKAATTIKSYSSSSSGGGSSREYTTTTNITIAGRDYEVNSSTGEVTYFNGSSGGSRSVSNGRATSSSSSTTTHVIGPSGNYIRHDGIERGAISSTTDDKKARIIRDLALKPIKADEVPQLLKRGEVVLNNSQQAQLVKNMGLLGQLSSAANRGMNVVLNMSNLTFNEVNNGQDFANFITKNLSNAVSQAMAK